MIINLTGQSGSGKTSIAKELLKLVPNSINIDSGDIGDIYNNVDIAYDTALLLEAKGMLPIISLISPNKQKREELKRKTEVFEVYLFTSEIRGNGIDESYEAPKEYFLPLDTTGQDPAKIADEIYTIIKTRHFKNLIVHKKSGNNI